MSEFELAYNAHLAADQAWMDEILLAHPREWAGDVRHTPRAHGLPDTPLRAAYNEFLRTRAIWEGFLHPLERSYA